MYTRSAYLHDAVVSVSLFVKQQRQQQQQQNNNNTTTIRTRAEGESAGEGNEENRLMMMAGTGGEEWGAGAKDRQQTTFSQPEQSYEAAFNKVCH